MLAPGEVAMGKSLSKAWIASCATLCVGILAYGVFAERDPSGDFAFRVGYNLPIAILVAGALHLVFRRREPASAGWIAFFAIRAALVASTTISADRQRANLTTAVVEIDRTITAAQRTVATTSVNAVNPAPLPTAPVAAGEAGQVEMVIKTIMNRMLAQRRDYELELEAIGWSAVLEAHRLRKDVTLTESKTMLRQARDIVSRYRDRTDDVFREIRAEIDRSGLSPSTKRSMLAGFDKTAAHGKAQTKEVWSLEEQALGRFENIVNLLAANRRSWQVEGGQILFNRQSDLDLFNTYLSQINELVERQQAIQEGSARRARETLQTLSR